MHFSTVSTILITLLSPAALAVPAPKPAPENNLAIRQPPTQTLGSCDPPNEPANQPSISIEPTPSLFILVINPEETTSTASTNPIPTETSPIKVFRITSLINETNISNDSTPDTTNKNANAPSKIIYRIGNFKAYLSNASTGGDSYVNFDFHDDRKDYRYDVGCAMHTYSDLLDGKYYPCGEDRRTWFMLSPWGIVIRYTWTGRSMAMTGVAPQPMNWYGGQGADADITVTENAGGKTFTRTTDWPFTVQTLLAGDVSPPTSP